MASSDNEVRMMMSVYPGAMTGFAAMNAGLSSILNVFNGMTRAFDQQFGLVDAALTTTSVVVTQLGVDAMNAFGQFEQGMKIVQMVSGQTASDMDYLKQKANEFSVEYRTDIDQITEGLQTLGRAGLNTASEQAEVLENGLTTAKLEGRELNSVLQELIQNTSLVGGNLKSSEFGEDSQYLNDLLVATSMTAPITTHDISETLKYSGGIAAAAGAKIRTDTGEVNEEGKKILEDYMGTIAAFAQKGVSGSIAGTALRAFLNKPATQDSSVTDALASIHLKPEYLWEEGEETMKPISEQIALIQNQMDELNVSTMDRLQIWSKIVGGKMGQQMMKLEADDIKEITQDIQAADSASNLAANSMKTYQANVKAAGESAALIQRNVGEKLVSIVNPWLELANKILEFLSQDFMSMPLAAGVIAFVGYLFTQIRRIASTVRSEISNLLALTKDARAFMHQSMTGRAQMDKEQVGNFVAMKTSASSRDTAIKEGTKAAESFENFNKHYEKTVANLSPLSFKSLTEGGITGDRMAVISSLQKMTTVDKFGIKDQDYVAAGMLTKSLPKGVEEALIKGRMSGLKGRSLLDSVIGKSSSAEFEAFRAHIRNSTKNLEILGLTAEQVATEMKGTASSNESGKFRYGSWHDSERQTRTKSLLESRSAAVEAAAAEEKKIIADKENIVTTQQQIGVAQAQANAIKQTITTQNEVAAQTKTTNAAIKQNVSTEQEEILSIVEVGSAEVVNAVSIAMDEMKIRANAITPGSYPGRWNIPTNPMITETGGGNSGLLIGGVAGQAYVNAMNQADNLLNTIKNEGGFPLPFPKNTNTTPSMNLSYISGIGDPGFVSGPNQVLLLPPGKPTPTPIVGGVGVGSLPGLATQIQAEMEKNALIPRSGVENMKLGSGIEAEKELMIEEQNLAVVEQIFRELLNIANRITKTRMVGELREGAAKADADSTARLHNYQATQQVIDNAKAANKFIEKNTYDQKEYIKARNALSTAGTGYPTRMSTSNSDQVIPSNFAKGYVNQQQANINNIKKGIESSSLSAKLTSTINTISKQNQGSSSTYMSGIKNNQQNLSSAIANQQELDRVQTQRNAFIRDLNAGYTEPKHYNIGQHGVSIAGPYSLLDPKAMEESVAKGNIKSQKSGLWGSVSDRWNADRTGRINFGQTTKGLRGMANGLLNLTDLVGGPVMVAFMLIPQLINMWKGAFESFCTDLKEAGDQLQEAYSKQSSAEDALEQSYRDKNPDATDDEIQQMVLDTYSTMNEDMANAFNNGQQEWFKKINRDAVTGDEYVLDEEADDGSTKIKEEEEVDEATAYEEAIKENTGALYVATSQLDVAISKYVNKASDSWWGLDGWTGKITNELGKIQDTFEHNSNSFFNEKNINNPFGNANGSRFSDDNEFLLTAQQKDENYAGYTEMAGLMLEDIKDAKGNWIAGMRTMMGDDVEVINNVMSDGAKQFLENTGKKFIGQLTPQSNARLQTSMKNDTKTWKSLAKELTKYELKNQKSVDLKNKQYNNKITGLINKLNASMGGHFSKTQILQAAYLMEMQEMYQVAQNTMVPLIQQNAEIAANHWLTTQGVEAQTDGTGQYTSNTAAIASSIAAMVSVIALAKSGEAYYNQLNMSNPDALSPEERAAYDLAQESDNAQDFIKKAGAKAYNKSYEWDFTGNLETTGPIPGFMSKKDAEAQNAKNRAAMAGILENYYATAKMTVFGYDVEKATKDAEIYVTKALNEGISPKAIYETIAKNYQAPEFLNKMAAAYALSDDGEGTGSGGGGSGSGKGSNKDKDTGTRKERVDLVLCNKKEIPKLNVNLFKKAPSFTILNKNFKLRDIKVNTQDKPKAVLASIKNAIIDVQKRTDPKIIQDEEAIYDPVGATDGNTPSGTSDVRTNTG